MMGLIANSVVFALTCWILLEKSEKIRIKILVVENTEDKNSGVVILNKLGKYYRQRWQQAHER